MSTNFGPCVPWEALYPCDIMTESPVHLTSATMTATEILSALSGRQFGACPITIRPCLRECLSEPWPANWSLWPTNPAGGVTLVGCGGGCDNTCSCSSLSEVTLSAPVDSIVKVTIDGSPIVTGAYRLDDNRTLVRIDGGTWPRCNNLSLNDTAIGTWSITANYGQPVPEGGKWAVGELTCQLLRAMHGEECRLPQAVTRLVRQGVTIEFPDIQSLFKDGLTGLYLVDLWILAVNPKHLPRRGQTYSVDGTLSRRPVT